MSSNCRSVWDDAHKAHAYADVRILRTTVCHEAPAERRSGRLLLKFGTRFRYIQFRIKSIGFSVTRVHVPTLASQCTSMNSSQWELFQ